MTAFAAITTTTTITTTPATSLIPIPTPATSSTSVSRSSASTTSSSSSIATRTNNRKTTKLKSSSSSLFLCLLGFIGFFCESTLSFAPKTSNNCNSDHPTGTCTASGGIRSGGGDNTMIRNSLSNFPPTSRRSAVLPQVLQRQNNPFFNTQQTTINGSRIICHLQNPYSKHDHHQQQQQQPLPSSSLSSTTPNKSRFNERYFSLNPQRQHQHQHQTLPPLRSTFVDQEAAAFATDFESEAEIIHHGEGSSTSTSTLTKKNQKDQILTNGESTKVNGRISTSSTSVALDDSGAKNIADISASLFKDLKSRPVPGGAWKPQKPLDWAKNFGRRSPEYEAKLQSLIRLQPGDEGYHDCSSMKKIPHITMVRTKEEAKIVMEKLMNAEPSRFHACDTEVMDIDLTTVGPVGNGYVTCASVYSGPDFDYGLGDGPGSTLWIDNLDDACGVLQEFKAFFEDPTKLKIWHNYGFDRHVMWNEGIDCQGFGGDTMHMARLQDTSRQKTMGGYSLEALTDTILNRRKKPMKEIFGVPRMRKDGTPGSMVDVPPLEILQRDPRFRENFILYSCYDAEGTWLLHEKLKEKLQAMEWNGDSNLYTYYFNYMREFGHVLTDMERRGIRVDAKDYLFKVEQQARKDREEHRQNFCKWAATKIGIHGLALNTASSVQLATFLFGGAENEKTRELTETERTFKVAREEIPEDALEAYRKAASASQPNNQAIASETDELDGMTAVQLKALCKEQGLKVSGKKDELKERLRVHLLSGGVKEEEKASGGDEDEFSKMTVKQLKDICKQHSLKLSGKKADLQQRLREHLHPASAEIDDDFTKMSDDELRTVTIARGLSPPDDRESLLKQLRDDLQHIRELEAAAGLHEENPSQAYTTISEALEAVAKQGGITEEILAEAQGKSNAESKFIDVTIKSLGMTPTKYTAGGAPSVTADVLKALAGDPHENPPKYGSAYDFFGGGKEGHEACVALYSLYSIGSIDTMIANFLTSLQSLVDDQSRVHCSLNINTETGRLSSRRPNLQNQPALEKDVYKIRKAFEASPGNSLIVADYGQLELRLLASMTRCQSMINAFESGGDFHSRTALDMFDYVRAKIDSGEVLLEWDYSQGEPTKPLLKDEFASERRKAKTLNFSIAYGKTAHGLSADWGVSQQEAQEMLDKWYDARPEVRDWQARTKAYARKYGVTRTLMGRYRNLPEAKGRDRRLLGHAERASINTPIQGGAADCAMMAMNKISANEKLKRLGWILLMQIHDEVILEGPEETAAEAFEIVVDCMQNPWVPGLHKTAVPLLVDGSYQHKTWYEAK